MPDIETQVRPLLQGLVSGRMYPNVIAQASALPAIAYQAGREPVNTLLGPTGDTHVTLTLILVATTFDAVRDLAAQVRQAMAADQTILKVLTEEPGDQYDEETKLHLYFMTYSLWQTG